MSNLETKPNLRAINSPTRSSMNASTEPVSSPLSHQEHTDSRMLSRRATYSPFEQQYGLRRRKVLIVEDDPDMAFLTRYLIERFANAKCDLVTDSYEAIEALCSNSYDYLVIDQNLPGLKGLETLKRLDRYLDQDPLLGRQSRFSFKIPVIIMSANHIRVPSSMRLAHFQITDSISKRELNMGLAKNFAS